MSERAIQNGYLIAAQSDIENLRARIAALEEEIDQWKTATGLEKNGCPEDVRSSDLERRLKKLEEVAVAAERVAKNPMDAVTRFNLDHALVALRSGR